MITLAKIQRLITLTLASAVVVLVFGATTETLGQRDPFAKPGWARTKEPGRVGGAPKTKDGKPVPPEFVPGIPSIEQRIDYFKRIREDAATNGRPLPKVTSVLALNEMQVTGIFKTPRGYAAMVEATPIKLSYTIYPGERFFDGQLVAVEENRLIFRKVTKIAKDKFATTVENMPLRKYTQRELIQGTAPSGAETTAQANAPAPTAAQVLPTVQVVSPLDEMAQQKGSDSADEAKAPKKPVRTARKRN